MSNGLRFGVCCVKNRIRNSAICRRIEQKPFLVVLLVSLAVETLTSFTPFAVSPNDSSHPEGPVAGPNRDAL